jgi:hypothetical protein
LVYTRAKLFRGGVARDRRSLLVHWSYRVGADTGHRSLKYEIESDWFFELMDGGLEFIKERDGEQIFNEVSRRLLIETLELIQYHRGSLPKSQCSLVKELIAERYAEDDKIDAYLGRLPRKGISTKAIAA